MANFNFWVCSCSFSPMGMHQNCGFCNKSFKEKTEEKESIIDMYKNGISTKKISQSLDVKQSFVKFILKHN